MQVRPVICLAMFLLATPVSSVNIEQINKQFLTSPISCTLSQTVVELTIIPDTVKCRALCDREPDCMTFDIHKERCFLRPRPDKEGTMYMGKYDDPCPGSKGYDSVFTPRLCYKLSRDKRDWRGADIQCKKDGGRLMLLNDRHSNDYMRTLLMSGTETLHWVGLKKIRGKFKWTDGSSYVKKWQRDEPDYVSYQNCGVFIVSPQDTQDGMSDTKCDRVLEYICEIPTSDY